MVFQEAKPASRNADPTFSEAWLLEELPEDPSLLGLLATHPETRMRAQLRPAQVIEDLDAGHARSGEDQRLLDRFGRYVLGSVTFVRLVECSAEGFRYGLAINRIRAYYKEIAGDRADLFLLSAHDDRAGVNANTALPREGRMPIFAFSSAVAVINSIVGGAAVAVALGATTDLSLGLAAAGGGIASLMSLLGWIRYSDRLFLARAAETEPLFPSRPA